MAKYVEVVFTIEDQIARQVLNYNLEIQGVESIEEREEVVIAYFKSVDWEDVQSLFSEYDLEVKEVVEENWNAVWEASFEPVNINDFCYVRAPFHMAIKNPKLIDIILEPKMAFGTAHHETTFMMMAEMEQVDFENKEVFDFGCGTAILSVLAEKLGSTSIYAIDIEENAIENAIYNAEINECNRIKCERKVLSEVKVKEYDIILANINRQVLLDSATRLLSFLTNEGTLLLSGILLSDETLIRDCYVSAGFTYLSTQEKGEWKCMNFTKHSNC